MIVSYEKDLIKFVFLFYCFYYGTIPNDNKDAISPKFQKVYLTRTLVNVTREKTEDGI